MPLILEQLSRSMRDNTHIVSLFTDVDDGGDLFGIVEVILRDGSQGDDNLVDENYYPDSEGDWELVLLHDLREAEVDELLVEAAHLCLKGMLEVDQRLHDLNKPATA